MPGLRKVLPSRDGKAEAPFRFFSFFWMGRSRHAPRIGPGPATLDPGLSGEGWEVIVVGGGPAGAAAALHLSGRARVLLLEKDRSPREKPCGGALSAKSLRELAALGLHPLEGGGLRPLGASSATRFWIGSREVTHHHLAIPFVSRRELDGLLLRRVEEGGAEVVTGARVVGLEVEEGGCRVKARRDEEGREEVFRAPVVIGADGASGFTSRFICAHRLSAALALEASAARRGEEIEIFLQVSGGYAWYFPHREGGQYGVFSRRPREALAAWRRLSPGWPLSAPPRGRAIACFPRPLTHGRLLLAGDAAGLADPLTGEGIAQALASGRIAALTALDFLAGKDSLSSYPRRVAREMGPFLGPARLGARLGDTFFRLAVRIPWLLGAAWRRVVEGWGIPD